MQEVPQENRIDEIGDDQDNETYNSILDSFNDAQIQFKNDFKLKKEFIKTLTEKKSKLLEIKKVMDNSIFPEHVLLNVGGMEYRVKKDLLTIPGSYFDLMFSGEVDIKPLPNNPHLYFIDRDGIEFRNVLEYLKNRSQDPFIDLNLMRELKFYNVEGFSLSTIMKDKKLDVIASWISKEKVSFKLIFKASENEFKASEFHRKCDYQGPTLILVRTKYEVFGIYVNDFWYRMGTDFGGSESFFIDRKMVKHQKILDVAEIEDKNSCSFLKLGFQISDRCNENWSSFYTKDGFKDTFRPIEYEVFTVKK
ncbi:hypothetical protein CYY_009612 [Polysphondylium violaceum]|uniref:BTB domain-containing protein n=1 Tax=Polysphondylium violaceum TaxID=133409 RepID=A0A8J4PLH1_9MYCE|nr:hypothetical protein CYY_009612 [Polysphondylium violaceum]